MFNENNFSHSRWCIVCIKRELQSFILCKKIKKKNKFFVRFCLQNLVCFWKGNNEEFNVMTDIYSSCPGYLSCWILQPSHRATIVAACIERFLYNPHNFFALVSSNSSCEKLKAFSIIKEHTFYFLWTDLMKVWI
jgi:hypothetical protein